FSSRRRHTRFSRDWSSDVCSSDLGTLGPSTASFDLTLPPGTVITTITGLDVGASEVVTSVTPNDGRIAFNDTQLLIGSSASSARSEERRVGKESGSWWPRCDPERT